MSVNHSRVIRYAELRRKIENASYAEIGGEEGGLPTDYRPDDARHPPSFSNSPKVLHNTLSIPLSALLEEDGRYKNRRALMSTKEFEAIDKAPEPSSHHKRGEKVSKVKKPIGPALKRWWTWALVGVLGVAVLATVIAVSLNL